MPAPPCVESRARSFCGCCCVCATMRPHASACTDPCGCGRLCALHSTARSRRNSNNSMMTFPHQPMHRPLPRHHQPPLLAPLPLPLRLQRCPCRFPSTVRCWRCVCCVSCCPPSRRPMTFSSRRLDAPSPPQRRQVPRRMDRMVIILIQMLTQCNMRRHHHHCRRPSMPSCPLSLR